MKRIMVPLWCKHCRKVVEREASYVRSMLTKRGYPSWCYEINKRAYLIQLPVTGQRMVPPFEK
jgi:hypothetical protein